MVALVILIKVKASEELKKTTIFKGTAQFKSFRFR